MPTSVAWLIRLELITAMFASTGLDLSKCMLGYCTLLGQGFASFLVHPTNVQAYGLCGFQVLS